MRTRLTLLLGSIAAIACGTSDGSSSGTSGSTTDSGAQQSSGGTCPSPAPRQELQLTGAEVCERLHGRGTEPAESPPSVGATGPVSYERNGTGCQHTVCTIDAEYSKALIAVQPANTDGGVKDASAGDASIFDAGGANMGCGTPAWTERYAGGDTCVACPDYTATVTVTCVNLPNSQGRPYEGYVPPQTGASAREFFACCMHMEAASVAAFQILEAELRDLGAPESLLAACRKAASDETRHATSMGRLAGATCPIPEVSPRNRGVYEVALENARVGMVRETYGAVVARAQALRAASSVVREALLEVSSEEMEHAQLSWDVDAYLRTKLSLEERQALSLAMIDEASLLKRELAHELSPQLIAECGLPDAALAAELLAALDARLWQQAVA